MAFATIQEVLVQPQSLGEVFLAVQPISGPVSYANPGGQVVSARAFGLLSARFVVAEDLDNTFTYYVRVLQSGKGGTATFTLHWYVVATNAEVANAVNLSASSVRVMVIGN